jgi:hypothetical protein
LVNDYYGFSDWGILQGETYFLGYNTGITHHYIDNDVENGRTYYYYLVAYDRGIPGEDANIAPAENIPSIIVDEEENITWVSPNVQIVTPHQFAADYVSPNLEVTATFGDIKGTGTVSIKELQKVELKAGHEYRFGFVVDTIVTYRKMPDMGYRYRNIGITFTDVTDSNKILYQATPEDYSGQIIKYEMAQEYYYLNPDFSLDPLDGIKIDWADVPSEQAEYDAENSGWIVGASPIEEDVQDNAYKMFPWKTDVVFTSGDITYTTKATDVSSIRNVEGIDDFDRNLVLTGQTFNFYAENKQYQDSLGGPYLLDIAAYDANQNGSFDMLEDDILVGYSSMDDGEMKWNITIFTFNFRVAESEAELPQPGDVYRLDSKRPFTATDQFTIRVLEPSAAEKKAAAEDLSEVKVVPNPYIVTNMMEPATRNIFLNQRRRLMFTHIPAQCDIKIFTISGYLVDEITVNNEPENGIVHWDLLTKEGLQIAPGIYVYYLKSRNSGKEKTGKFAVIK